MVVKKTKKATAKPVKKPVAKKTTAKKAVTKKITTSKKVTPKSTEKKSSTKAVTVKKKAVAAKATEKKQTAKKVVTAKKSVKPKKATTKKTTSDKVATKKATSAKRATVSAQKATIKKAPAKKVAPKPKKVSVEKIVTDKVDIKEPTATNTVVSNTTQTTLLNKNLDVKSDAIPSVQPSLLTKQKIVSMNLNKKHIITSSLLTSLGIEPYKEKDNEEYMNSDQLDHFKEILLRWREQLVEEADRTIHHMQEDATNYADPADRASQEEDFRFELRARDRERKLIKKIESALRRINDGSYGFCDETGEPIGLQRLEARPVATYSIEAQERHEKIEGLFGN